MPNLLALSKIDCIVPKKIKWLIADSGGTKTDWLFYDGKQSLIFQSQPLHPYFISKAKGEEILLREVKPGISSPVDQIFFYGAGCAASSNRKKIRAILMQGFNGANVYVDHDLTGAAHACLQNKSGLIAIIGTGSNSGFYDGMKITEQVDSLGFILGDEGSGADLGKRLLKLVLRKELSPYLFEKFNSFCRLSRDELLIKIYSENAPNQFLASFAPWIHRHKHHQQLNALIESSFTDFISNQIVKYSDYKSYPLNLVGSVAFHFKKEWLDVMKKMNLKTGTILKSPLEGLLKYHLNKLA